MRILNVGQCSFDHQTIGETLQKKLNATVDRANSAREAMQMARQKQYSLVLVNRVFDADGTSGVGFIRQLLAEAPAARVMLVSNYADAQKEAVAAGALPGFGKSQIHDSAAIELVREACRETSQK